MYINKPSVTEIEAANRVNLLHGTRCTFEQYKSSKPGKMLVFLPGHVPFYESHQKDSCFQT